MGACTVARWNLYKNRRPLQKGTNWEIKEGFTAAEQGRPFDSTASEGWQKGYHSYRQFLEPSTSE